MAVKKIMVEQTVRTCDICNTPHEATDRRTVDVCDRHTKMIDEHVAGGAAPKKARKAR